MLSLLGNGVQLILPILSVAGLVLIMVSNDDASVFPALNCIPALPFLRMYMRKCFFSS